MNYFQMYLICFSFVILYQIKNCVSTDSTQTHLQISVQRHISVDGGLSPRKQICTSPLSAWEQSSYSFNTKDDVTLTCCDTNNDPYLEWFDVKNNITLISTQRTAHIGSVAFVTLNNLDIDDDNSTYTCASLGNKEKNSEILSTSSIRFQLFDASTSNFDGTFNREKLIINDINNITTLQHCKNDVISQIKGKNNTKIKCYYLKNDTNDHGIRYKTSYLAFYPQSVSTPESLERENDKVPLLLVIGVVVASAISIIIIAAMIYYVCRTYIARKISNEHIYAEPVQYAEIQVNSVITRDPTLPSRNDQPYAEIVGIMTRN